MLTVPPRHYDAIVDHAAETAPAECCGVLGGRTVGDDTRVTSVHPTPNVANTPRVTYVIDPEAMYAAITAIEADGDDVVGFYHSHPTGPDEPSPTDQARATWDDHVYVILSLAGEPSLGAWYWRADENAFAPEPCRVQ